MELGLGGRAAVVTGASKGIGRSVAEGLAAEGCNLHIVSRTRETIEQAAKDIQVGHGVEVSAYALDRSDSANIKPLLDAACNADILVNNAGAIPGGDLHAVNEER